MRFFSSLIVLVSLIAFTVAAPMPDDGGKRFTSFVTQWLTQSASSPLEFVDPDSTQQDAPHWF